MLLNINHVLWPATFGCGVHVRLILQPRRFRAGEPHKNAPYGTGPPSWIKIKSSRYSQAVVRHERFDKRKRTGRNNPLL
jgi:hypothetical protein